MDFEDLCLDVIKSVQERQTTIKEQKLAREKLNKEEEKFAQEKWEQCLSDLTDQRREKEEELQKVVVMKKNDEDLQKQIQSLQEEIKIIQSDNEAKLSNLLHFNNRKNRALGSLSLKDQMYMESLMKRLKAFKKLTCVYWDYTFCDHKTLCGYIYNKKCNKAKAFKVNLLNKEKKEIAHELWSFIYVCIYNVNNV
ncbi:uncharacterized protein LOC106667572 [Cimex lectularius]|uniref:Uncharacterized protein n=1 Tax=Cimex lectularius TaxID=79782 RepID=A0A8I6RRD3_CIMLE|nr:uncharacterized protein LOC106667572 [Cimex lectularius]